MNATFVIEAMVQLHTYRDTTAAERYFSPSFRQHSAQIADGQDGLRALVASLPDSSAYYNVRAFQDGDLVALHGLYEGLGPYAMVAFDLYRVDKASGLIVEHWDALMPFDGNDDVGPFQLDGPPDVQCPWQTAESAVLVREFVEVVLLGDADGRLGEFMDPDHFTQHCPQRLPYPDHRGAGLHARRRARAYDALHRLVAEGEFVLTQAEGTYHGIPYAYYDLFRVDRGRIVEHWDVITPIPVSTLHDNGFL